MCNGCNGVSLGDHGVPEGDRIPSLKSHMERRWNKKVVSLVSSQFGKGIEGMYICLAQFSILVCLLCRCLGCCTGRDSCDCCVGNVGLCISVSVWYCHIPGHRLSSCPGQKSCPIRPLVVVQRQTDWFLDCRHLCALDSSPQDVVEMAVTLLSRGASAAGESIQATSIHSLPHTHVWGSQALLPSRWAAIHPDSFI